MSNLPETRVRLTGLADKIINHPDLWKENKIPAATVCELMTRRDGKPVNRHQFSVYRAMVIKHIEEGGISRGKGVSDKQRNQFWSKDFVRAFLQVDQFRLTSPEHQSAYCLNDQLSIEHIIQLNLRNLAKMPEPRMR